MRMAERIAGSTFGCSARPGSATALKTTSGTDACDSSFLTVQKTEL